MRDRLFVNIRPTKIKFYLRCAEKFGFVPAKLLVGTGLTKASLDDPHLTVPIHTYIRVVSNLLKQSGSPTIAFELGQEFRPGDLGVMGLAFAACANDEQAITLWEKYNWHFFGCLIEARRVKPEGKALRTYEFLPRVELLPHLLQFFMEEKIAIDVKLLKHLGIIISKDQYFSFAYPAPGHAHLYEELLDTKVVFSADRFLHSIHSRAEDLNKPFLLASEEALELCVSHLNHLTDIDSRGVTFLDRLEYAIARRLQDLPSVSEIAKELGVSTRTFYRKLEENNSSYRQVVAAARIEAAENYLSTTSLTPDQIAPLLGYKDTNSFRRAFKSWRKMTVTEYLASL